MNTKLIKTITDRWSDPSRRPLFKGKLWDPATQCGCAQGDILINECSMSGSDLIGYSQSQADKDIASALGISLFHSVLLRIVNDSVPGCPQDVLLDPEKILGKNWKKALDFAWHIDEVQAEQWELAKNAWREKHADDAYAAAAAAAGAAAVAAGAAAVAAVAADDAQLASRCAIREVIGAHILAERGNSLYFLPIFGFNSIDEIPAHD